MRRISAAALVALALTVAPTVAHADETVVVAGTGFPDRSTYLTYFGCSDLYADVPGPLVRVTRDEAAPAGRRAVQLAVPGVGGATGAVSLVDSVATATSTVSVRAPAGSQGVGYVWYVAPDLGPGEVWAGRADLVAGADGWQQVDAMAATYTWTRLLAATGEVLDEPGPATVAEFTADHGDGPGYLLTGFGCDGREFGIDRIAVGTPGSVTTYDLEGWPVTTTITASSTQVDAGGDVELTATSTDPWGRAMSTPVQLEARTDDAAEFTPVPDGVATFTDGVATVTARPELTTEYRWAFPETDYTDAHWSEVVRVVVEPSSR